MYGLYILLPLLLFIAFLPFIRFFVMRWAMLNRLRSLGKRVGFSVHLRSPFSLFSMVGGKTNDLYIQTAARTYSVKLLGFPMKKMMLCFLTEAKRKKRSTRPTSKPFCPKIARRCAPSISSIPRSLLFAIWKTVASVK